MEVTVPASLHKPQTFADAEREGILVMLASSMALGWQGIVANHFWAHPARTEERIVLCDSFTLHAEGPANLLRRRWEGRWDKGYSVPKTLFIMPSRADCE